MILEKPSLERCSIWVTAFCAMLAVFLTLGALQLHASDQTDSKPMRTKAWEFEFQSIGGDAFSLSEFEGKVVMVVNTASRCGFTNQYNELQALWDQFKGQKFILLGVPSNDFGQQEPGTESEIKSFCEINFNIDFPMTAKVSVVGDNAHPLLPMGFNAAGWYSRAEVEFSQVDDRSGRKSCCRFSKCNCTR